MSRSSTPIDFRLLAARLSRSSTPEIGLALRRPALVAMAVGNPTGSLRGYDLPPLNDSTSGGLEIDFKIIKSGLKVLSSAGGATGIPWIGAAAGIALEIVNVAEVN